MQRAELTPRRQDAELAKRGISVRDFPFGTRVTVGTPDENTMLLIALTEIA